MEVMERQVLHPGSKLDIHIEWHRRIAKVLEEIGWITESSRLRNDAEGLLLMFESGIISEDLERGPEALHRRNVVR